MNSKAWFTALVGAVAAERVAELVVSQRNLTWSLAHGGREESAGHYPAMVAIHTGLLVGSLAEVWLLPRSFHRRGWLALGAVVGSQGLRWWCIRTLGPQWNTRIVVIPGAERVTRGPYRRLQHPNYVAVVTEGASLPLVHDAWITSLTFSLLNAAVLRRRIAAENAALSHLTGHS